MADKRLPCEIITDILSRLAVKDLLRFRCVSKPWCSLIDGPDFIKLQLNQSLKTTSHHRVIFRGHKDLYWIDLDAIDSATQLTHPPIDLGSKIDIFGSCNGLLALGNPQGDMAIWNPSTGRYRILPLPEHELHHLPVDAGIVMMGFVYDPLADDYKLISMIDLCDLSLQDPCYTQVWVHSLKAKTWKKIGNFNHRCIQLRNGFSVPIGYTLHWTMNRISDMSNTIIAFDLLAKDHRELALPDDNDLKTCFLKLSILGGCLSVSAMSNYNFLTDKPGRVDVWVMKEYGVTESWIKLFSVVQSDVTGPFHYLIPVAYLKGGDSILLDQDGQKLLLYDVKRKRVRKALGGSGFPRIIGTHVCVESLARLDVFDGQSRTMQVVKNKNDEENRHSSKKRTTQG